MVTQQPWSNRCLQRGSVNFKHRCATRNPVFVYTRSLRRLATEGNPSRHVRTLILAWRQREVVPLSGMQSVPVIMRGASIPQLWNTNSWWLTFFFWDGNWGKGISFVEIWGALPPAEKPEIVVALVEREKNPQAYGVCGPSHLYSKLPGEENFHPLA